MYKPTKTYPGLSAVALKYQDTACGQSQNGETNKGAPKIVAKGSANVAQEIIEIAQQHGVLIHKDDELSQLLGKLDLGQEIPEGLYHVIAELIAFSYVLQGKFPSQWNNTLEHIDFKE